MVKDCVLSGEHSDDFVLLKLIEISLEEITSQRYNFPIPLHEPIFYRLFKRWVKEGMEERQKYQKKQATD
jgi:hypothetical protein